LRSEPEQRTAHRELFAPARRETILAAQLPQVATTFQVPEGGEDRVIARAASEGDRVRALRDEGERPVLRRAAS